MVEITEADRVAAEKYVWLLDDEKAELAEEFARHRLAARAEERRSILEWLHRDNGTCDCAAREAYECACGGWDDDKRRSLLDIAADIESGEHIAAIRNLKGPGA